MELSAAQWCTLSVKCQTLPKAVDNSSTASTSNNGNNNNNDNKQHLQKPRANNCQQTTHTGDERRGTRETRDDWRVTADAACHREQAMKNPLVRTGAILCFFIYLFISLSSSFTFGNFQTCYRLCVNKSWAKQFLVIFRTNTITVCYGSMATKTTTSLTTPRSIFICVSIFTTQTGCWLLTACCSLLLAAGSDWLRLSQQLHIILWPPTGCLGCLAALAPWSWR